MSDMDLRPGSQMSWRLQRTVDHSGYSLRASQKSKHGVRQNHVGVKAMKLYT